MTTAECKFNHSIAGNRYNITTWYIFFASAHSESGYWYRFPSNGRCHSLTSGLQPFCSRAFWIISNWKCIESKVSKTRKKSSRGSSHLARHVSFVQTPENAVAPVYRQPLRLNSRYMRTNTISYGDVVSNCHVENAIEMQSSDSIKSKTSLETEIALPSHLSLT